MREKIIKNIFKVFIGNFFVLMSGIIAGFLLPKILGITNYGYYKVFTLYCTYISILHFGFVDGIYLKYGDIAHKKIDNDEFKNITGTLITLEILISLLVMVITLIFFVKEYKLIFAFVSLNIISINCTLYFQVLSQIRQNFEELKNRNIIKSLLLIVSAILLFLLFKKSNLYIPYYVYLIVYTIVSYLMLIWYLITYRDFFKIFSLKNFWRQKNILFKYCKIGLPLTLANIVNLFILSVDRQFVNICFLTEQFAVYSFAYSILSLLTTTITSISTVLYPFLKTNDQMISFSRYEKISQMMMIISVSFGLAYYPLFVIIKNFLPEYIFSLKILVIMIPSVSISSLISIVCHNYYKVLGKNRLYFIFSIIILFASILFNFTFYIVFRSMFAISVASLLTYAIWYVLIDFKLFKLEKKRIKYILLKYTYWIIINAFFIMLMYNINIMNYFIYIIIYIVISLLYYVIFKNKVGE